VNNVRIILLFSSSFLLFSQKSVSQKEGYYNVALPCGAAGASLNDNFVDEDWVVVNYNDKSG